MLATAPTHRDSADGHATARGALLAGAVAGGALCAGALACARAAAAYARVAREKEQLVRELSDSRARLVTIADHERRRIERDLHDGAQQRLVALQIRLALLREQIEPDAPASAAALRGFEGEIETASEEVRALAHGIYPPQLTERGLAHALRAAARAAPLPTTVRTEHVGRYDPAVESTVYFACMEALQTAAKHAHGASGVAISVTENGRLRFEVRDDGPGFSPAEHAHDGSGLANLRDRLAAVGGELEIRSAPGAGTRVAGVIPSVAVKPPPRLSAA
jgi:signal transduction histidine kinase